MTTSDDAPPAARGGPDRHSHDVRQHRHQNGHRADHAHDRNAHDSSQSHGHENDQGLSGMVRYLRHAPQMWRSEINATVVELIDPKPGELVVDLGAGMGAGASLGAHQGATVLAIEPTPFLRRILWSRSRLGRSTGSVVVLDGGAEHLPIADRSVDALWSVNTMHHWVKPDAAAAEIARVLRPSGRLLLVDEDFADPTHPDYDTFGAKMSESEGHSHGFSMVDVQEMGERFDSAGIQDTHASKQRLGARPSLVVRTLV